MQQFSPRPYNLEGGCAPQAKQRVAKPTPQALKSSMLPKPVSMNDSRTPVHNYAERGSRDVSVSTSVSVSVRKSVSVSVSVWLGYAISPARLLRTSVSPGH